jgi:membrane protein DedA with SNARE-associated domain
MITILDSLLGWLSYFKYLAMFGILFLCGTGLPIPEEVTLVASGLLHGWGEADFLLSSLACVAGILAGDSIIFGMGYHYGRQFLLSRPMRFLIPPRRQVKVGTAFAKHGNKAVFIARFFAGIRIGVYAYAGSQRMSWLRFLWLDLMGALISGPTSIFVGSLAARTFAANRAEAKRKALHWAHQFGHWLILSFLVLAAVAVALHFYRLRRQRQRAARILKPGGALGDGGELASKSAESLPAERVSSEKP